MTAKLWDIRRGQDENEISTFKGHGRSVKCIEFRPSTQNEFATGSRENSIFLWDTRDSCKVNNYFLKHCRVSQRIKHNYNGLQFMKYCSLKM